MNFDHDSLPIGAACLMGCHNKDKPMDNVIICESCGCRGKAIYSPMPGESAVPVFSHLGHDIHTADMHYRCARCGVILRVNPMHMLGNQLVRGIPSGLKRTDLRMESFMTARDSRLACLPASIRDGCAFEGTVNEKAFMVSRRKHR